MISVVVFCQQVLTKSLGTVPSCHRSFTVLQFVSRRFYCTVVCVTEVLLYFGLCHRGFTVLLFCVTEVLLYCCLCHRGFTVLQFVSPRFYCTVVLCHQGFTVLLFCVMEVLLYCSLCHRGFTVLQFLSPRFYCTVVCVTEVLLYHHYVTEVLLYCSLCHRDCTISMNFFVHKFVADRVSDCHNRGMLFC